jgi:glucose/arabinose dehydrogenase
LAAHRPWRTVLPVAALALVAGACGQGTDQQAQGPFGPDPAPATTKSIPATSAAPAEPPTQAELDRVAVELERVTRLREPVALAVADDDTTFYVGERAGRVRAIRDGRLDPRPLLDLTDPVAAEGEGGLLGVAVAPDGRHLYVSFTDRRHAVRLVEVTLDADGVDPASRREVLTIQQPSTRHHGGNLVFGPDGLLWIGIGDGSPGGDPANAAQSLGVLSGKLLRLDPTPAGSKGYTVPATNPFVNRNGARPEIWAYGLRNPWRFSFDRATRDLWIGDVGQYIVEEIDAISLRRSAGGGPSADATGRRGPSRGRRGVLYEPGHRVAGRVDPYAVGRRPPPATSSSSWLKAVPSASSSATVTVRAGIRHRITTRRCRDAGDHPPPTRIHP